MDNLSTRVEIGQVDTPIGRAVSGTESNEIDGLLIWAMRACCSPIDINVMDRLLEQIKMVRNAFSHLEERG